MSPCATSGKIDCIHCHTSSGRYRFKKEKFNNACVPCHEDKVNNPQPHTHHSAEGEAGKCISCHMPMTAFARMNRSDHSMLPPAPAATMAYQSPNACNGCHGDKDAAWADALVRQWRTRDYQAPVLARAALIAAARKRDWAKLPDMLAYIRDPRHNEVFAASLVRLVPPTQDRKVLLALLVAAKDPSPLVRGAAVEALGLVPATESLQALVEATADDYRLVRVRAAAAIAAFPRMTAPPAYKAQLARAEQEYLAFVTARPDQWTSHYNLGNYRLGRGENREALASFEAALRLEPQAVTAMVNASIAHARLGEIDTAETWLQKALQLAPDNAAANFNMGLVQAEKNEFALAESHLKKALKADPRMAQAAYNLCVITAKDRVAEAVTWCRKAADLAPQNPSYAYTLAFYLNQKGDKDEAVRRLQSLLAKQPGYRDAEMLLGELTKKEKKP
jgi:tetratricopeptide (TPR) repeat protein